MAALNQFLYPFYLLAGSSHIAGIDSVIDGILGFLDMQLTGLACLGI